MKNFYLLIFIFLSNITFGQTLLKTTNDEINSEIRLNSDIISSDSYIKGSSKILIAIFKNGKRVKYKFINSNGLLYSVYYSLPTEEETIKVYNELLKQGDYESTGYKDSYKKKGTANFFFGFDTDSFGRKWYGWEQIPF